MYVYAMKAMKKTFLLFLFSLSWFILKAQQTADSSYFDIASIDDSLYMPHCFVIADSDKVLQPASVLQHKWGPLSQFVKEKRLPPNWIPGKLFLLVNLKNSQSFTDTVYFYPGLAYSSIKTFIVTAEKGLIQQKDLSRWDGYQPLELTSNAKLQFLFELVPSKTLYNTIAPQLIQNNFFDEYKKRNYYRETSQQAVGYLFSGLLLMMFFFSLANYLLSFKKEFLYNSAYAACMLLLVLLTTYFERQSGLLRSFFTSYLAFMLLSIGSVFYIAFTRTFLNTKANYPTLDKVLVWGQWIVGIIIIAFSLLHFFADFYALQHLLENIMKITALLIGLYYVIFSIIQKKRLLTYLAIGNAILIVCSLISFYILFHPMGRKSVLVSAFFYYELGVAGEIVFFLLGLAYKNRIELINTIKDQEALKLITEKNAYETKLEILNIKQKERNRISADMHDELGAGITAIRLYSELAKNKKNKDLTPEIEKISHSADELLNNMNAIIWAMSSSNDTLENMVAYIRSYAQEYFENTSVTCKISIMDGIPDMMVSGEIRKNVFLVVKEALNNILKHSKATEVNIALAKVPEGLSLFIQDNGVGIDGEKIRRFGNGLKNMRKRMEDMWIQFKIENNNGTLITLHYPIDWKTFEQPPTP